MARSLGSPALLAAVWCGMALLTLAGALCFTELAIRNPHDGGEYLYLRRGFGARPAFLYGWMAAIVDVPWRGRRPVCRDRSLSQALLPVSAPVAKVLPALILITLGALNYFGTGLQQPRDDRAELAQGPRPRCPGWLGTSLWTRHHGEHCSVHCSGDIGSDPLIDAIAGATISASFASGAGGKRERSPARSATHRATLQLPFPAAC